MAALTLSVTLFADAQTITYSEIKSTSMYMYSLQMPLKILQLVIFQRKYPLSQHVILTLINYIHLDRPLRNNSREETQKECYKIMTIAVLTCGFRKLYLKLS